MVFLEENIQVSKKVAARVPLIGRNVTGLALYCQSAALRPPSTAPVHNPESAASASFCQLSLCFVAQERMLAACWVASPCLLTHACRRKLQCLLIGAHVQIPMLACCMLGGQLMLAETCLKAQIAMLTDWCTCADSSACLLHAGLPAHAC